MDSITGQSTFRILAIFRIRASLLELASKLRKLTKEHFDSMGVPLPFLAVRRQLRHKSPTSGESGGVALASILSSKHLGTTQ
jgi:hypothetical protein